jgi:hypothetical protein
MAARPPRIPNILVQPASVDFIENRLVEFHDAFNTQDSRYDSSLQRFVSVRDAGRVVTIENVQDGPPGADRQVLPPRKLPPAVEAMQFWTEILPEAMKRFEKDHKEPDNVRKQGYSIRKAESWNEIHAQLERAKEKYDGPKEGFRGRLTRTYRKGAGLSQMGLQMARVLPEADIVSPVKAAVNVLLDVSTL